MQFSRHSAEYGCVKLEKQAAFSEARRIVGHSYLKKGGGVQFFSALQIIPSRMNSQTKPVRVNMLRPLENTAVSAASSGTAL